MSISCKVRMMVMWVSIPENKEFGLLSNLLGSGVLSAQHQWSGAPGKGTKSNVHACWCLCIMTRSAGGVLWDSLFHFLAQRRLAQNYTPTALLHFHSPHLTIMMEVQALAPFEKTVAGSTPFLFAQNFPGRVFKPAHPNEKQFYDGIDKHPQLKSLVPKYHGTLTYTPAGPGMLYKHQ